MADSNEKYLNLITSEHKTKPMYKSYVEAYLKQLSIGTNQEGTVTPLTTPGINNYYLAANELFNIETAVGSQLDIIGELVGLGRKLPVDSDNIENPLNDETYRLLLRAKLLKNNWNGTFEGIQTLIGKLFPDYPWELVDNQDMSITFNIIYADIPDDVRELFTLGYIIPKPAGVNIKYNIQNAQAFGWDLQSDFVAGWETGIWANS